MSIATTSDFETMPASPLARPLILAAICVALADWLFYGWDIGISLAAFLGVLGVVALFSNGMQASGEARIALIAVFTASLLPLVWLGGRIGLRVGDRMGETAAAALALTVLGVIGLYTLADAARAALW